MNELQPCPPRLRTEEEYVIAMARFDKLWDQPHSEAATQTMSKLIIVIEEFEARQNGNTGDVCSVGGPDTRTSL
jgi:hypothetical protein